MHGCVPAKRQWTRGKVGGQGSKRKMGLYMLNFWMLLKDCLASGVPASASGNEEIPGKWLLVMGRANVGLISGSFMPRSEHSRNSNGGNSVCSVMYLSLIK